MTVLNTAVGGGKVGKWGNSLGIRIPSEVMKLAQLSEGAELEFFLTAEGDVVMRPKKANRMESLDREHYSNLLRDMRSKVKPDMEPHEQLDAPLIGAERFDDGGDY